MAVRVRPLVPNAKKSTYVGFFAFEHFETLWAGQSHVPDDHHPISTSLSRCSVRRSRAPKETDWTHWYHFADNIKPTYVGFFVFGVWKDVFFVVIYTSMMICTQSQRPCWDEELGDAVHLKNLAFPMMIITQSRLPCRDVQSGGAVLLKRLTEPTGTTLQITLNRLMSVFLCLGFGRMSFE